MFKGSYPQTRLRRLRASGFLRALVAEHSLSAQDLILPLFVCENDTRETEIVAMPGIKRWRIRELARVGKKAHALGIPAVALFPVVPPKLKSVYAQEALNPHGLVPRAVNALKSACPELGIVTDVALDPYTTSGHDGICDERGEVKNDATVEILCRQALCLAAAGADVLAPSDMMDGRVGVIRRGLDGEGYENIAILSYAAKYASAFYGPFRAALGTAQNLGKSDKRSYQMDPANQMEALRETALDVEEGADIVMVKPGCFYLDVVHRIRQEFAVPVFVYQVSGEYVMLKMLAGKEDVTPLMMESLIAFKRAGASAILSYFALEAAAILH